MSGKPHTPNSPDYKNKRLTFLKHQNEKKLICSITFISNCGM